MESDGQSTGSRKLLIALGAIAGIVIVIWGGYILYNKNNGRTPASYSDTINTARPRNEAGAISSTPGSSNKGDTASNIQSATAERRTYKFIIERTANKDRAIRRYNQLLEHLADVRIETQDSTMFKLYFELPATASDTARIRDSLKTWYGRRRVYVE